MFKTLSNFFETWGQLDQFKKLDPKFHELVIYSEGPQDWPHIGPMVEKFFELSSSQHITYLTSEKNDPGINFKHERFKSFYIGSGSVRTIFFKSLRAKFLLMSLPDLEVYQLKRSVVHNVHYVYCFHSINSAHAVYRERAFEFYDTIFCVGAHHVAELRTEEEIKKLKPRTLLEHGSVKLDTVIKNYTQLRESFKERSRPLILLAPSWGTGSFAENPKLVRQMIEGIIKEGWECRLRLHPMTVRHNPQLIKELRSEFGQFVANGLFEVEDNLNDNSSLRDANVMVSDWSGAATEFAFGLERPVLFLNTPQKINNPKWQEYGMPGLEDFIRHEVGQVLEPSEAANMASSLRSLMENAEAYKEKIRTARQKWIFNVGSSAEKGATYLLDLLAL
jgi:hypothetical protein